LVERTAHRGRIRPAVYEGGGDGRFHDGLLMDLLHSELTEDP
jgi:hypothetical protein